MSGYFEPREYPLLIELGAGPFYSPMMGNKFANGYLDIEYFDGPDVLTANRVTPGAGELLFEATGSDVPDDANTPYGSIPNGTIDCTDLAYLRPNWAGRTKFIRVTETVAVTVATHALIKILRT
jgi:hypothetical protein